jgi:hypothetical protein
MSEPLVLRTGVELEKANSLRTALCSIRNGNVCGGWEGGERFCACGPHHWHRRQAARKNRCRDSCCHCQCPHVNPGRQVPVFLDDCSLRCASLVPLWVLAFIRLAERES